MEAVIFVGIQASGKTTFYNERFFETHVRLSLDMLRTRRRLDVLLRACLEAQQPFVLDNTSVTAAERAPYIVLARAARFHVVGYYFVSDVFASLRRNEERTGKQRIPAKGIFGTRKRLEVPTAAEGFDRLYSVAIDKTGAFVVREWSDAPNTPAERSAWP